MHVSRMLQPAHQRERSKAVDHVVHIKPVARAQSLPYSSQRAVERVPQPVQSQAANCSEKVVAVPDCKGITCAGSELRRQAQQREMVRADAVRRALCQPEQCLPLHRRNPTFLDSPHLGVRLRFLRFQPCMRIHVLARLWHPLMPQILTTQILTTQILMTQILTTQKLRTNRCHTCLLICGSRFRADLQPTLLRKANGGNALTLKPRSIPHQQQSHFPADAYSTTSFTRKTLVQSRRGMFSFLFQPIWWRGRGQSNVGRILMAIQRWRSGKTV